MKPHRLTTLALIGCLFASTQALAGALAPTHHYTFDSNANDAVGSNDGTLKGGASIVSDATRIGGGVLDLENDSGGRFVELSGSNLPSGATDTLTFTVSTWTKLDDAPTPTISTQKLGSFYLEEYTNPISGGSLTKHNITVRQDGGVSFDQYPPSGNSTGAAGNLIADGAWHHMAVAQRDVGGTDSQVEIWIDGILAATGTAEAYSGAAPNYFYIGARHQLAPPRYVDGMIDDMGFWSDSLEPEQIALTHGLGKFALVDLDDQAIDDGLTVFDNTSGTFTAGGQTWQYATGLGGGSDPVGTTGGSVAGNDAYIVLDDSGNGVQLIPEPSAAILLLAGLIGFGAIRRKVRM
jgi:hypothetical protein